MQYAAKAGNRAEIFKDVKALKGRYGANVRGNSFGAVDWQMRNLAVGGYVSRCYKSSYATGPISKDKPTSIAVPSAIGEPCEEARRRMPE